MNEAIIDHANAAYQHAEEKSAQYFAVLHEQLKKKTYITSLSEDIRLWKKNHFPRHSWLSIFSKTKKKPSTKEYHRYIQWLDQSGKLENYLHRSVSYMYMRDLGKTLDSPDTQAKISRFVEDIKQQLTKPIRNREEIQPELMSAARLYRWAQKEGIEEEIIWVINKLDAVSSHIPKEMNAEHAQRKLIKIIIGVVLHVKDNMDDNTPALERSKQLGEAIRLGYSYGLTYPYIDDLLDSGALTTEEQEQYSNMIREALLTGVVPDIGEWQGKHNEIIYFIHSELREAFKYIKEYQSPLTESHFFEQSYVFFCAQNIDRVKNLANANYTNEELYIPVILKSSSSRLIVRSVIRAPEDAGFEQRTFYYGIYNQLADDFADMLDDLQEGAVTPYTYYVKYRQQRPDLINPFELYWTVISHIIHHVHHSDTATREVILDRAINSLKRCKERVGAAKYEEIMNIFAVGDSAFHLLIQQMVQQADDVDFFDKLLRDQLVLQLANNRKEKEHFQALIATIRKEIDSKLHLSKPSSLPIEDPLFDAANYSLNGDGKRIRPILTWVMGVNEYGLQPAALVPLLRSLEFMHTASLIFDDLPSQDNAATRRGRATLHCVYDSATAELTALLLIQKAIQEQSSLDNFDAATVLKLIQYSARKAEELCRGQSMDLQSKGMRLTLEQMNAICYYKTGVAFEASLVMPAILAKAPEGEVAVLKKFAYHAGIAFQIKDDLLDIEGDMNVLGKPVGQDMENNNSNFVSILGANEARKMMWEHYCLAAEALHELPRNIAFLKHLLHYLVNRLR
ncbi:polyprenyl synthetase family protein [Paenibacillus alvei]|uniref:polyprenyl synthetase family protein n=1 Tax=Paenibacillus alvei TaxID=44250 RepID=UPI0018CC879D|nr:polyprenyl synthetase family protein [Paenibacillus alvei]MBG9733478.1 geranyl transferase [Paenibacillus alvei]MBG9742667.1 geranyl transferase [Paenibacillus alvei]MCY9581516.1 polyprenyl synthetase family protein [Paenibacillus alvei]MCY9585477.1 polyprenyl synthetase family protein [Paenibacillus alvei]